MAVARVAGSHAETQYGNSASARTLQYAGTLTAGSLLVVTVSTFNASITVTVIDDVNGAYINSPQGHNANGAAIVSQWHFPNNASSGQPTVTVTPSATAYVSISIEEFTGVETSSAIRGSAGNDAVSATIATGTVTATAGDLVVASSGQGSNGSVATSVDSPFTLVTNLGAAVNQGIYTAYHLSAVGDEGCTFNLNGTVTWPSIGVSYKAAAGGGGGGGNPWYAYAQQ